MNIRTLSTAVFANLVLALAMFAHPTSAMTVEVVSISPEPQQDISDLMTDAPENVGIAAWLLDDGVEYTTVLAVDEAPAVVINIGGDMAQDQPWVYDEAAGTLTVVFTSTGIKQTSDDSPDNAAIIAVVPPVEIGEDGPPVEMTGAWLNTNVQDWELIPPSPDNIAFGFSLTGPTGETGFFHMFMPDTMVELLSELSGEDLTIEDLAVFNGDDQSSMSITEVEGGAYIDINVTFSEAVVTPSAKNGSVTKSITIQEQLPISLAANKTTVRSGGSKAHLFGWIKSGQKGKTIEVWRKVKGADSFTKWKHVKTDQNGRYEVEFTASQTAFYKVKSRAAGKIKTSSTTKITVQ